MLYMMEGSSKMLERSLETIIAKTRHSSDSYFGRPVLVDRRKEIKCYSFDQ